MPLTKELMHDARRSGLGIIMRTRKNVDVHKTWLTIALRSRECFIRGTAGHSHHTVIPIRVPYIKKLSLRRAGCVVLKTPECRFETCCVQLVLQTPTTQTGNLVITFPNSRTSRKKNECLIVTAVPMTVLATYVPIRRICRIIIVDGNINKRYLR